MSVITISGKIASGKSELAKILGDLLETPVYLEPVSQKDNPILPLYYNDRKKYGFLLQIFFLNRRFEQIKKAYKSKNAVLDSIIYTDSIFLDRIFKDGLITKEEHDVYHSLVDNMMEEIEGLPYKKTPDLMIGFDISFENELKRISIRDRSFEQDDSLYDYFKNLSKDYDEWFSDYDLSPKLTIDGNKYDFVNDVDDKKYILRLILDKLLEINQLTENEFIQLNKKVEKI